MNQFTPEENNLKIITKITLPEMRKLILLYSLVLLIGCGKKSTEDAPAIPKSVIAIDVSEASPGDAIIVKLNQKNPSPEINISLNGKEVRGYTFSDSAYIFTIPVVPAGAIALSIPSLANSNTLNLNIKSYAPISNPQAVINEYVVKRNEGIDSLTKVVPGSNFQPSTTSIDLLNQLKEEWDLKISTLNPNDKELLAYVLQRNMLVPAQYNFEQLPPGSYARILDTGDKLVAIAKTYVTIQGICLASIPFMVTSGYAFLAAPNPISGLIFLGFYTTFIVTREVAVRRAEEVGRLKGVAEEITETFAQRTSFTNLEEKTLYMDIKFRNLVAGDVAIHPDVNVAYTTEQTFANKDRDIEGLHNKIIQKTVKLRGGYPSYNIKIGKSAQGAIVLPVEGEEIIVKGVSDSRITHTVFYSGTTKKVRMESTANVEIPFDLTIAYRRSIDNKEYTKNIQCLYKPEIDSIDYYKSIIPGSWSNVWQYDFANNGVFSFYQEDYITLSAGGNALWTSTRDYTGATHNYSNPLSWSVYKSGNIYIMTLGDQLGRITPTNLLFDSQPATRFKVTTKKN